MRLSAFLLAAALSVSVAACSSAPRTVDKPARPGAVTPPVEEVDPTEEGDPDVDDAPVEEVPVEEVPTDSTGLWRAPSL